MSLDVTLYGDKVTGICRCPNCENEHEYTTHEELFSANITHNLGEMAGKAGIYEHLWCPEELGITKAGELVEPLKAGLADMKARPEYYKQFDSPNGWGRYIHFVPWIEEYLNACIEYPEALISVSR